MNKKGFTLIELLAVIVILAIIALIATPAVLNIIEDSKESAAKDSAMTIAKAAETYYMSNVTLQGREVAPIDLTKDTLQYKGEKPEKGYIEFDEKGNAYLKMYMNGYCVVSDYNNTVVSEKMDSEDCTIKRLEPLEPFEDGDVVYFNPVKNIVCKDTDYNATTNSVNGFKGTEENGCMRWYAILDTEDATSVRLFLDHDTDTYVKWNANGGSAPDTLNATFASNISGWDENVKSTARLITAYEVNEIVTRYAENVENYGTRYKYFVGDNVESRYYIGTGDKYASYNGTANGPHELAWLFNNTYSCKQYGCEAEGSSGGIWTSTNFINNINYTTYNTWVINNEGFIVCNDVTSTNGIRPVIEVSKTKF